MIRVKKMWQQIVTTKSYYKSSQQLFLPSATKLRRLCFYTCLSFCSRGGGVCLSACWDTTPGAGTPWEQTPPRSGTPLDQAPPGADPLEHAPPDRAHPPGADTPQSRHPQSRHPPSPPREQHCCGRYAPGMHSCYYPRKRFASRDGYCCGRYASMRGFTGMHSCYVFIYWNAPPRVNVNEMLISCLDDSCYFVVTFL